MAVRRGRIELFPDDQLVVALPDLKIIASTLERFGVRPGPAGERPVLGPALIRGLANVDTAVSELLNGGAGVLLRVGRRERRHRGRHRGRAPVRPPGAGGTARPRPGPARLRHPAQRSGPRTSPPGAPDA